MKKLSLLILTFNLMFCSCNDNESDLTITLPITETYIPASVEFDENSIDKEQKRNLIYLVNHNHIVNSASDLPNDPIGFGEAYYNINFEKGTLLIKYLLHDYTLDTYNNRYYRNTRENIYNWVVDIATASNMDIDTDKMLFTRFAILVDKLPADANVKTGYGLSNLGRFPSP